MTLWMAEGGPVFNRRLSVGQSAHPVQFTSADNNDSINYADLSDFFYVWLKRGIGFLHSDLLSLPLTPKREQVVMNVYASAEKEENRKAAARQRYIDGMSESFHAIAESLDVGGMTGVVFAHTDPDAWATLIDGLLGAGLVPDATWPIDTEAPSGLKTVGQARLKTSVWMACRKREEDTGEAFLGDVLADMRLIVRERLLYFWSKGIRGADFFISAIGPALSVFGRYSRVLRPDGTEVTVRDFLDIVRRESTTVALEQVLQGADLGIIDPETPVRHLGLELLQSAAGRRGGHRPVPRHRGHLRRHCSPLLNCRRGPGEEQEGGAAAHHPAAGRRR